MVIILPKELYAQFEKSHDLKYKYDLDDIKIETVGPLTEEFRKNVNFIVTLGGDGTILWASKQFSGDFVPPMITFDQGSLGFLCNFVFEDHK